MLFSSARPTLCVSILSCLLVLGLFCTAVSTGNAVPAGSDEPGNAKPAEAKPAEDKPAESKPSASEPEVPQPSEADPVESKPAESTPSATKLEPAEPAETKPTETEPTETEPTEAEPVETKPVEPTPVETVPAKSQPAASFTRLADPAVATLLGLTDEQKAKVSELMTARAAALAGAAAADRARIVVQSESKLAAVLSEEQRAEWPKVKSGPRLRLNFRFQRWVDVLEWVAEQAGLSLVLDAPPPGTFNYSDTLERTPSEAIDLLNGVLLTKGYTLIRRERMLLVINLGDGIPEGLIPRVTLDELGRRGKFELVSVLFPLGRRNVEEVNKEITPLLGPHGKAVPLPKTGQLLVTDTAGIMQAIGAVIESIPEPTQPKKPEKPEQKPKRKPEKPQLVVYPVRSIDPKVAIDVLKQLLPDATFVLDPRAEQINAYATPSQHEAVNAVLEQMQANNPPEKRPRLEVYPTGKTDPAKLVEMIQVMIPGARLSFDAETKRLVAWATPEEHATLKMTIEKLRRGGSPQDTVQLEVYQLATTDPAATLSMLETLLPDAQLALDTKTRRLVAMAVLADQQAIKAVLAELQGGDSAAGGRELRVYRLLDVPSESLITGLGELAPAAQITLDPSGRRLVVVGSPSDHKSIKAALERVEETTATDQSRFETYEVHRVDTAQLLSTLKPLVPGARLTIDPQSGKLVAWATDREHTILNRAVGRLEQEASPLNTPQLVVYRLTKANPQMTITLLKSLVPSAKLTHDTQTNSLIAVAIPADQQAIQRTLKHLQPESPRPDAPQLRFYRLTKRPPPSLIAGLKKLAPAAEITLEAAGKRLMVVASPDEHEVIKSTVAEIEAVLPREESRFEVYPVHGADAAGVLKTLQPMVPDAKLTADPKTNNILAWATDREHEVLNKAVGKLGQGDAAQYAPRLEVYRLSKADPNIAITLLQGLAPAAKLSVDTRTNSIIAMATPGDHQTIKSTVERLEQQRPGPDAPQLRIYPLLQAAPPTLVTGLQQLAPNAQVTLSADGKQLTVVASAADHKLIKESVDRVEKTTPLEERNHLVSYPVTLAQRKRFMAIVPTVTAEFPGIQVVTDAEPGELSIWAKPTQHEMIGRIIGQLKREVPVEQKYRLVAYTIRSADPASVLTVMQGLFPDARLNLDTKTRRLLAWASPAEHEKIKTALAQIDADVPAEVREKLTVYPMADTDPQVAIRVLENLVPDAKLTPDPAAKTIVAWARASDHEIIAQTINDMQAGPDGEHKPRLEVYPTGDEDPASVVGMLQTLAPDARLVPNQTKGRIAAWATPKQHETIKAAIEKMSQQQTPETAPKVATYRIGTVQPWSVIHVLRQAAPRAQIAVGAEPDELIVWARPADHKLIRQIVEQMVKKGADESARKVVVYTLQSTTAAGVMHVLRTAVPSATLSVGADPHKLVVWARAEDHQTIATIIEELSKEEPAETAAKVVIYPLKSTRASSAIQILQVEFPQARFSVGADPRQLIAWARPAEHEKIKQIVDQISEQGADAKLVIYPLGSTTAASALPVLRQAVPEANFSVGSDPHQLIAWARPEDHATIKAAVEQLSQEEPEETAAKVVVYTLQARLPYYAIRGLSEAFPQARFSAGTDPRQLIAWARPADHAKIKDLVDKLSEEEPPKAVVYPLESTTAASAMQVLREAFPEARFSVGSDPHQLIAMARPADHVLIKSAVEQLSQKEPEETAPRAVVYTLKTANPYSAMRTFREAVPTARFTVGADRQQLIAWARPADHKVIQEIVEQMSKKEPPETAPKVVVYPLKSTTADSAMQVLREAFREARFSAGSDPHRLIAWAHPEDHVLIKAAVEQLSQEEPEETAPKVVIYTLQARLPYYAIRGLGEAFPQARFTVGTDDRQLIAWARPADHKRIKELVEKLSNKETAPKMAVYPLKSAGAADALSILQTAFPEASFSAAPDDRKVIAWARPDEHALIKTAVEQIESAGAADADRVMAVYPMKAEDAATLLEVLDPLLKQHAQFVSDPERDSLVVWADKENQERIKAVVEQFKKELPEIRKPVAEVYYFRTADPQEAVRVLSALVPEARMAANVHSRSLVVSALPEDQEKVKAAVEQMERKNLADQAPKLQAHRITTADPVKLFGMLQTFFRRRPEVQLTLDEENEMVMAVASPAEHETIGSLIRQVEEGATAETTAKLEVYSMKNVDSVAVMKVLETLLEKQRAQVQLSLEPHGNQLVAIARPDQQKIILETIDRLRTEDQELEIYQLDALEPSTAELAIDRLFGYDGYSLDPSMPVIDSDEDTQQLFISATKEQHKQIRQLLVKMGETGLKAAEGDRRKMRVVPFRGDRRAALEEIMRVWPQLRKNPIRIGTPDELVPEDEPKTPPASEAPKPAEDKKNSSPDKSAASAPARVGPAIHLVGFAEGAELDQKAVQPDQKAVQPDQKAVQPDQKAAQPAIEDKQPDEPPPVTIVLGEGNITIKSDDPEALDQMESLLRSLSQPSGYSGRKFSVFTLKHTDATRVAAKLQELFRSIRPRWQRTRNRTMIVADERLNAVVVRASRPDRAMIENLVKVLDAAEAPDVLAGSQPTLIPVKYTRASQIEDVIRQVFKAQLTATGAGKAVTGPGGLAPQISVDDVSNSLVLIAPEPLRTQITRLIDTLDEAAGEDSARGLKIISLKNANASRVQDVLDAALRRSGRRRGHQ